MKIKSKAITAFLTLVTLASNLHAANGTWTNKLGGTWSTAVNWSNSVIANAADFTADFSALPAGITNMSVTNDAARTLGNLKFGAVTNWFLVGANANVITLSTNSGIPNVNVVNNIARVGVPLSSSQQVLMSGASLALTNDLNTLTGGVVIQAGQFGFTSQGAIGSGVIQLGNGPGGNVAGPGQTGFNAISSATAGTVPVTLTNDFVVRTTRWIAGQSGVGLNAQPIIINGNVSLDMGTNGVRDLALQQPLTINGVFSSVSGGNYGVTLGALAGGPLTLANSGNSFVGNITFGVANTLGINSDGALGYFLNRLVFTAAGTLRADAPLTISANRSPISLTSTATFNCQTNDVAIDPVLAGAGGLIKNGTGKLTITSGFNTFSGAVTINAGTLDLEGNFATAGTVTINNAGLTNASKFLLGASASAPNISVTVNNGCNFDATAPGGYTFATGKTLSVPAGGLVRATAGTITMNSGSTLIAGSGTSSTTNAAFDASVVISSGATLIPATQGTAGTISITNGLTLNGQSIQFDLRSNATEGSGTNDEIIVGGALTLNGGEKIVLNYVDGSLAAGTYTLMRCGSQSGSFTLAAAYPNVTLNQSGTVVSLTVGAGATANNLIWKGDGAGNVWDANTTANWVTNFAFAALNYTDPSKVIFDNNGSNNVAINLSATVLPNSVTFSNTKPYTISGSGKISGPVAVTVVGLATNTFLTDNDYAGGTTFATNSTLILGNGGATGAAGSGTITMGSTGPKIVVNHNNAITLPRVTGSGQVIQNGSGTTTLGSAGDNASLAAIVNGGILNLGKPSDASTHSLGANSTVNAGGTLQLGGTGGDQIFSGVTVTNLGGTFDTAGNAEQFTTLTGYGSVIGGSTISLGGILSLSNAGTLAVTNTAITITTASAQWLQNPGSVIFEGGSLNLPANAFTGAGAAGNQNILIDGGLTTAGNGETIFGENTESSVVTFGPNANATVWFWSFRDSFTNTFWYNGGNLTVNRFNYRGANNGAAQSIHYFNGTTLTPRQSINPGFMNAGDGSRVKFYVSTNGLIINDAGFNLGIAAILAHDSAMGANLDGGLTKSGSAVLALTATNTFNGSVTVNGGTLQLNNAGAYNNVTFADNTTYQVSVVSAGVSLTNSSLTLGTTGGGTQNLIFALGTLGIPTQPVVKVNNVLTNSGPVVVTITAPFLSPGIAPLIKYGSMDAANFAATWSVATFPYVNLTLTNDTVNKLISVIVDPGVTPKWKGNISSAWDTTTLNWTSNAIAALYVETTPPGQPVTFDNTAVNFNVDISTATVNPLFVNVTNSTAYTFTGTLGIAGTGALIKSGSGSLTLSNASSANTYSGITTVSGGSIVAAQPNVLSPNSAMTLNNSTLNFGANNQTIGAVTLNNTALIGNGTLNNGSLTFNNGATSSTLPPISGTLNLTQNGTGTLDMTNANTWGGALQVNAGTVRVNDVGSLGSGGFLTATLTRVETGAALVFDGANGTSPEYIHIRGSGPTGAGALVVTNGNVTLNGGSITALDDNSTVNIGANASLTNVIAFNGAGFTLTKIGGGLLYFSGAPHVAANAGTTIDSGSCTRVTVNSGGIFGGAGSATVVDVKSGGVLAPGNLGIGTMTVSDSLTNAGNITMEISYNGVATNADRVNVTTNLVYGGTLTVTNVGPNPLAAGHSFKLFNAPSYANGSFSSVTLPTLASGLGWTNRLAIDGTIAVIATVSTTPFPIGSVVNGGNLELTWPADHTGWRLQVQTNSLSTGLNTNWSDVSGSTLVNSVTNVINAANGSVFYRMVYP